MRKNETKYVTSCNKDEKIIIIKNQEYLKNNSNLYFLIFENFFVQNENMVSKNLDDLFPQTIKSISPYNLQGLEANAQFYVL